MTTPSSPASNGGASTRDEDIRVEVAELSARIKGMHEAMKELAIAVERLRHRLNRGGRQMANPE